MAGRIWWVKGRLVPDHAATNYRYGLLCKPTKYISRAGGEYDYAFSRLLVCDRTAGWSIVRSAMRKANEAEGCKAQCHDKPKVGQ